MRVRHFSLAFSFASLATISAVWALQHRHWVAERHESRGRSCLFDDTVPVMVARHALAPGRPVSAGDVALVQMPWKFPRESSPPRDRLGRARYRAPAEGPPT
jgi:hypothetical protein